MLHGGVRIVHTPLGVGLKLRNTVGAGGWFAKALLFQSLVLYVFNKMAVKTLL